MVEKVNKNQEGLPVDYLRDRPFVGELQSLLQKKFPAWVVEELLDILKTNNYMIVKKIPVRI